MDTSRSINYNEYSPNVFVIQSKSQLCMTMIDNLPDCIIFMVSAGFLSSLWAIALLSIGVYIFIKYGSAKLKWYILVPALVVSWTLSILFASLNFIDSDFVFLPMGEGFCSISFQSFWYYPMLSIIWSFEGVLLSVIFIFSILTFHFVRKHTIEENAEIKKAIVRVLLFFFIGCFLNAVSYLVPSLTPLLLSKLDPGSIGEELYILRIFFRTIFLRVVFFN